jgi:hypothetical protein
MHSTCVLHIYHAISSGVRQYVALNTCGRVPPGERERERSHGVGEYLLSKEGGEGKTKKGVPEFTL